MLDDAASLKKERLRADLRAAMKDRNVVAARVIRSLIAAIDNAEAPALSTEQTAQIRHEFASGSAEIARLELGEAQVHNILLAEAQEREHAASEFDRLERPDRAAALREESRMIRQYLE